MMKKRCHIETNGGRPYCLSPSSWRDKAGVRQCEYPSRAAAKRAKAKLQQWHCFRSVKVVDGECPV